MAEEEIVAAVDQDPQKVPTSAQRPRVQGPGIKVWPSAIPPYEPGHFDIMEELDEGM